MRRSIVLAVVLAACASDKDSGAPALLAVSPGLSAFPHLGLIDNDGQLSIPVELLPSADTPVPVDRLTWRTGFSPVQTTVLDPGVALDPASLPPPVGTGPADAVQLWDLDRLQPVPALVELDAWPDNPEVPRLLVRPMRPLPVGHTAAVLVSDAVRTTDGAPLTRPDWFRDARAGAPIDARPAGELADIIDALVAAGAPEPVLGTAFPVGDGRVPLDAAHAQLGTPTAWSLSETLSTDAGDALPEGTWIQATGTFTTDSFLADDRDFVLDGSGTPALQGQAEADLFVFVPDSVQDASPGTVPVWIFGHGIFARPQSYLAEDGDPSSVIATARAAGAIVVATTWRGLTSRDIGVATAVGTDFGRIPELTDKLAQGVLNTAALARLVQSGGLMDDPLFGGLARTDTLFYYGISLGGIEGATLFAVEDTLDHGVLHVPGGSWSTMLERSSNWTLFEELVSAGIESPGERQVLYAASQLFWDPVDPALRAADLRDRSLLWQGSVGDEQVPNMTTDLVTAAADAALLGPSPYNPDALFGTTSFQEGGGPRSGPVVSWFDPEQPEPPLENRPAPVTGAHSIPRVWPGQNAQTVRFLDASDPGWADHFCGTAPCTASNPGG